MPEQVLGELLKRIPSDFKSMEGQFSTLGTEAGQYQPSTMEAE